MQRTEGVAPHNRPLCRLGLPCGVANKGDDRVELGVYGLDPLDVGAQYLYGREFLFADSPRQLGGVRIAYLLVNGSASAKDSVWLLSLTTPPAQSKALATRLASCYPPPEKIWPPEKVLSREAKT